MSGLGPRVLAVAFLAVTIPIETAYSWPTLIDPYYVMKLAGWALLTVGLLQFRGRPAVGLTFLASGWAWFAANFGRALSDRVGTTRGKELPAGPLELWFTGGCLLIAVVGLVWTLFRIWQTRTVPVGTQ